MNDSIVPLKTIGILGGMSAQSTADYYRLINEGVNRLKGGYNNAEVIICSVNFENIRNFMVAGRWDDAGRYLAEKARRLEAAGCDYLFLATNTLHKVRDQITGAVSIPFVDIFEATAAAIRAKGLKKVALLGTYTTMADPFCGESYRQNGVDVVIPGEADMKELDRIIFDELCYGKLLPESKEFIMGLTGGLRDQGAEGVILGCTEIKLLMNQEDLPGFPVFDTTTIHCAEAVRLCVGEE